MIQEFAGVGDVGSKFFKQSICGQLCWTPADWLIVHPSLHLGWIKSLDSKKTHIADRFFLGGPFSLRGFEPRGVGPRASGKHAAVK